MISDEQQRLLHELNTVFLEENTKLNLSAFRTKEASWIGNIIDSLAILELQPPYNILNTTYNILDIGTGGGFPLLPLAVILPDATVCGLDSIGKKMDAIGRIGEKASLENLKLFTGRTEEFGRDQDHREHYDIVTARALAPLPTLIEYASPFVKPGGYFIAWKSMNIKTELEESLLARAECSLQLVETHVYELPGEGWGKRQLLVFHKRGPIRKKYPREVGMPKKDPIG